MSKRGSETADPITLMHANPHPIETAPMVPLPEKAVRRQRGDAITGAMVERACRAYVRGVQETFRGAPIDYGAPEWIAFEDENWMNERIPMRKALEAALS